MLLPVQVPADCLTPFKTKRDHSPRLRRPAAGACVAASGAGIWAEMERSMELKKAVISLAECWRGSHR